jgi:hypothetical protein
MSRRNPILRNRKELRAQQSSFPIPIFDRMRRGPLRLKPAAKIEGSRPETVQHWVGSALRKKRPMGDYYAKPYDRVPREVRFVPSHGWVGAR